MVMVPAGILCIGGCNVTKYLTSPLDPKVVGQPSQNRIFSQQLEESRPRFLRIFVGKVTRRLPDPFSAAFEDQALSVEALESRGTLLQLTSSPSTGWRSLTDASRVVMAPARDMTAAQSRNMQGGDRVRACEIRGAITLQSPTGFMRHHVE